MSDAVVIELLTLVRELRAENADLREKLERVTTGSNASRQAARDRQRRKRERDMSRDSNVTVTPPPAPPCPPPLPPAPPNPPPYNPPHPGNMPDLAPFEDGEPPQREPYPDEEPMDRASFSKLSPSAARAVTPNKVPRRAEPAPKPKVAYSPEFEAFWAAYPPRRRVDKAEAFQRWRSALASGATVEEIVAGLAAWKRCRDWLKDDGEYVCAPAVWLNKRRWEAAPPPVDGPPADAKPIPPEVIGKPWLGAWLEHGGMGTGVASVMNLAAAIGADPSGAQREYKAGGLAAAGDWAWSNRRTG